MLPSSLCAIGVAADSLTPLPWRHHRKSTDIPLICQVRFIADKHDDDITSSLCPHVLNPFRRLLE